MAKPNAKGPVRTVQIFCAKCRFQLLKYRKGGKGALVKCFKERIVEDYTNEEGICPSCNVQFGRNTMIRGAPALKIVGGKVLMK
ncbi:hypothetical protein D1814_15440 [Alteromonas sp. BL110]|uniref:hypothetical protein n=1 Tax=Alteromonas sp. BL110 TaxID=1714845 RepID=UPI000E4CA83B|nr:hypothetical protein [Alteromonas sp. BL110]AXT39972.1 hypothetical protein D1814_15440 [Alteromonas sp. BL110]RKM79202.1 hypothetical protein D7031_09435 [Alteromonas sp. BL110]